jgi:RNA polymerase sigma factor (sigma-70 family)
LNGITRIIPSRIAKLANHVYDTFLRFPYRHLYRRNIGGCTLSWETRFVQDISFEKIVKDYSPLVKSQIYKLNLTMNYPLYEQAAMIALWECVQNYQGSKGSFSAYAYLKVRGKLLDERRKELRASKESSHVDWNDYEETFFKPQNSVTLNIDLNSLTMNQRKWVEQVIIEGKSLKNVATAEGVSVEAVKSWRKSAITKLRKQFNT